MDDLEAGLRRRRGREAAPEQVLPPDSPRGGAPIHVAVPHPAFLHHHIVRVPPEQAPPPIHVPVAHPAFLRHRIVRRAPSPPPSSTVEIGGPGSAPPSATDASVTGRSTPPTPTVDASIIAPTTADSTVTVSQPTPAAASSASLVLNVAPAAGDPESPTLPLPTSATTSSASAAVDQEPQTLSRSRSCPSASRPTRRIAEPRASIAAGGGGRDVPLFPPSAKLTEAIIELLYNLHFGHLTYSGALLIGIFGTLDSSFDGWCSSCKVVYLAFMVLVVMTLSNGLMAAGAISPTKDTYRIGGILARLSTCATTVLMILVLSARMGNYGYIAGIILSAVTSGVLLYVWCLGDPEAAMFFKEMWDHLKSCCKREQGLPITN